MPEDLVIFGGDGSGDPFGIWAPPDGGSKPLIVKVGAIFFDRGRMAVVGTSFSRFLLGRTAYYLLLDDTDPSSLDLLGVPRSLRTSDPDDATYEAIVRWADPELPGLSIDPYMARLTEDDIRQMASSFS